MAKSMCLEERSKSMVDALSRSRVFLDYRDAFTNASGMPLELRVPHSVRKQAPWMTGSAFCETMAGKSAVCKACYDLQYRLERESVASPHTLTCFAGLCETAVPVRLGKDLTVFLETGHVLLSKPNRRAFGRLARTILNWGANVDLKQAEHVWLATRVIPEDRYEGFIRLLSVFARHLELTAEALTTDHYSSEPNQRESPVIERAKEFIQLHSNTALSLSQVAKAINLSANYFCKHFHDLTGMSFIDYVAKVRVEKARLLLKDSSLRVSEAAFEAGFQSVSQFNRTFKRIVGLSPTEYRRLPQN